MGEPMITEPKTCDYCRKQSEFRTVVMEKLKLQRENSDLKSRLADAGWLDVEAVITGLRTEIAVVEKIGDSNMDAYLDASLEKDKYKTECATLKDQLAMARKALERNKETMEDAVSKNEISMNQLPITGDLEFTKQVLAALDNAEEQNE